MGIFIGYHDRIMIGYSIPDAENQRQKCPDRQTHKIKKVALVL